MRRHEVRRRARARPPPLSPAPALPLVAVAVAASPLTSFSRESPLAGEAPVWDLAAGLAISGAAGVPVPGDDSVSMDWQQGSSGSGPREGLPLSVRSGSSAGL